MLSSMRRTFLPSSFALPADSGLQQTGERTTVGSLVPGAEACRWLLPVILFTSGIRTAAAVHANSPGGKARLDRVSQHPVKTAGFPQAGPRLVTREPSRTTIWIAT